MAFINATLIVQACNFIIAFYIIKYFLFRPIFAIIEAEDILQESLIGAVQEHQLAVMHKEQELVEHWQSLRLQFGQQAPSLKREYFVSKKPEIIIPVISADQEKEGVITVSKELISQVDHVA